MIYTRIKYKKTGNTLESDWFVTSDKSFVKVFITREHVLFQKDGDIKKYEYSTLKIAKDMVKSMLKEEYGVEFSEEIRGSKIRYDKTKNV